jgi:TonB family protein
MSAFNVMSKKSRFKLGVAVVIIIHIGFFIGFWHVKAKRLTAEFVNVDIYAPTAATGLAMYEALPNEECVKVVNEQAPRPGMPIVDINAPLKEDVIAAEQAAADAEAAKKLESRISDAVTGGSAEPKAADVTLTPTEAIDPTIPAAAIADTQKIETKVAPEEVKLAPSLYYASAPRCKGVVAIPAGAERLGAEGFVGLELNINQAGTVQRSEIHRSSGFADLDEAALKQVKENLTFKPCQKGTVIVGCKQFIKFRWKTN